jgi:hypothetical protein
MGWAVREGVKAEMRAIPALENVDRGRKKLLRDTAIPVGGVHRERTEKAEAPPVRGEIRANELLIVVGGDCGRRISLPPRVYVTRIAHKLHRIRHTEKSAEREPDNAVGFAKVAFSERTDACFDFGSAGCHCFY